MEVKDSAWHIEEQRLWEREGEKAITSAKRSSPTKTAWVSEAAGFNTFKEEKNECEQFFRNRITFSSIWRKKPIVQPRSAFAWSEPGGSAHVLSLASSVSTVWPFCSFCPWTMQAGNQAEGRDGLYTHSWTLETTAVRQTSKAVEVRPFPV